MTSALRTRAMAGATKAAPGDARVEPGFATGGRVPPVVTDEVSVDRGWPGRRVAGSVLRLLALGGGGVRRINLLALALVVLGMGLAVFAMGLVLYFWPHTPSIGAPVAVIAPERAASAAQASIPTILESRTQAPEPAASAPLAQTDVMPTALPAQSAEPHAGASSALAPEPPRSTPQGAVEDPVAQPSPTVGEPEADATFGADANANSVPDALDRWLTGILQSSVTQEAGRQYYRTVLPLATKLHLGITLSSVEKLSVLRAAECYLITATEEGLPVPPNLNNRVLIQGGAAAERMKGLFKALQGIEFPVSSSRRNACE